jgi:hypothetical protein
LSEQNPGFQHVRIVMTGHGKGEVFLNGVKVPKVKKVVFSGEVDCANEVTLTVHADRVEVDGDCAVTERSARARQLLPYVMGVYSIEKDGSPVLMPFYSRQPDLGEVSAER